MYFVYSKWSFRITPKLSAKIIYANSSWATLTRRKLALAALPVIRCVSFYARFVGRPVSRRGERPYLKATKEVLDEVLFRCSRSLIPFLPIIHSRLVEFSTTYAAPRLREIYKQSFTSASRAHTGCMM